MRKSLVSAAGVFLAATFCLVTTSARAQALKTEDDKTLYTLGLLVGRSLTTFNLTKAELELVKKGINDQVLGVKPQVDMETYGPKVDALNKSRQASATEKEKGKSKDFLDKAAKEKGAQKLPSGLVYSETKAGTGAQPTADDTVKVHYKGTLTDGTEFDSSIKRGQPAEFPLKGVIPCWTEGVAKMKVGGKAKLVCPSTIAYGDQGRPPQIPGGATLVFEVELLEVVAKPPPAATPPAKK
jgi:FKBP-type peptidyl-prolyl cis-trans isomerase FkpA